MGDQTVSTEFSINEVVYGDRVGMGLWSAGHYRQHLAYNAKLASSGNHVVLADFPIFDFPVFSGAGPREIRFWLEAHENWHEQVRAQTNVTSANLADLDWKVPAYFYDWLQVHFNEHQLIDIALGF